MPVTAMLSLKLYEKLGEDVAKELVEWFNLVDATYRHDLRELNELNFARFDAKLEQRMAQLDARWEQRSAELKAEFHREIGATKAELIKWSFAFWAPVALAVIGLYFKR